MTIFFTSDPHYGHTNIIRYCKRPFENVSQMDEELISRWNSKVNHEDTVYLIGDFAFCDENKAAKILDRLQGNKILIFGNHDKGIKKSALLKSKFQKCVDYEEIHINNQFICMSHYAMLVWNKSHHGAWMIHGHSHGSLKYPFEGKILDVGVDSHNFYPISFDEMKVIMSNKKYSTS